MDDEQRRLEMEMLNHVFSYHSPTHEQLPHYEAIRDEAKRFAQCVLDHCPRSADRTAALRKLREVVMTANASIALDGKAF